MLFSFCVECGAFVASLARHIGQLLQTVRWRALKSLELSGNNIDAWIDLWANGSIKKLAPFKVQLFNCSD